MAAVNKETGTPDRPEGMPVFYKTPEALNPSRHGGQGLVVPQGFAFARESHAIPLAASEMPMAMRSYPIVFGGSEHMPVAITGIRSGQNLFVEENGSWSAPHYVPAYVRRYPFILAGDTGEEKLTLCVEPDPERVVKLPASGVIAGEVLPETFFENGKISATTRRALAFCEEFQAMINATRATIKVVADAGLLTDRQGKVTLDNGEIANITDFQVVDEEKFNSLPDEDFLALRRAGALAMVYCHLASMNSWQSVIHQARLHA